MGVQHTNSIDVIAHDPASDVVTLIMSETRPWDGSDRRLFELQEKANAYVSFALDGEMLEIYPQFAGKNCRLLLETSSKLDPPALALVAAIRGQISFQGIDFVVRVVGAGGPLAEPAGSI